MVYDTFMMTRDQLRAARILLHLDQRELAELAKVGVATVRRFEGGEDVGVTQHDLMRLAVEGAGAVLIAAGKVVDADSLEAGVALLRRADLPPTTLERLSRDDFGRRKAGVKPDGRAARSRRRAAVDGTPSSPTSNED